MSKTIRATLVLRNNRLLKLREEAGIPQLRMAELIGVSSSWYCKAEQLKPIPEHAMEAIAIAFDKPVEWLFSEEVRAVKTTKFIKEFTPTREQIAHEDAAIKRLCYGTEQPDPEDSAQNRLREEEIERALASLSNNAAEVMRMSFGLSGAGKRSIVDIAKKLNMTSDRVRRLYGRAIRQLRHPKRSRVLKEYIEY